MSQYRTHVYCPTCQAIKPKQVCNMIGLDVTNKFCHPTDILCSECFTIVATEYDEVPVVNQESSTLQ